MGLEYVVNKKDYDALKRRVNAAINTAVKVGFLGGKIHDDESGMTTASIAAINEYGSEDGKRPPPRPFFQITLDKNKRYAKLLQEKVTDFATKKITMFALLNQVGIQIAGDVQEQIIDLKEPANAESTIKRKKSSNPLVETNIMADSVTHKVVVGKE